MVWHDVLVGLTEITDQTVGVLRKVCQQVVAALRDLRSSDLPSLASRVLSS